MGTVRPIRGRFTSQVNLNKTIMNLVTKATKGGT